MTIALAGSALAIRTTITSAAWIDRVFPSFVLLGHSTSDEEECARRATLRAILDRLGETRFDPWLPPAP